eukprot:TRINITY_DN426_c0_g2_i1.p1 TRINITY_DN426_c0_g2~~TRINITY_DN426_c0_g2_i1.p1  ORF type:complete len:386 (+),score=126.04 TRINITY_DN426_c0_g2_i1:95-1252(+)
MADMMSMMMSMMGGGEEDTADTGKGKGKGKGKGGGMNDMMAMMMAMMGGGGKGMMGKGMSKAASKVAKGEKVYYGKLRSYNAERSSGFIFCQDVFGEHGSEVYAFKQVLENANAGVGDELAFFLHWSAKGQPQASAPVLRLSSSAENNLVLKGTFKKGKADYGFIQCQETMDYFGRDVYVGAQLAANIESGQLCAFNVMLNRDGMPNACLICPCDDSYGPVAGDLSVSSEMEGFDKGKGKGGMGDMMGMMMSMMGMGGGGGGKGKGGGYGKASGGDEEDPMMSMLMGMMGGGSPYGKSKGKGKGGGTGTGKKPTGTGQYMTGTVKSWSPMNNYGFIECAEVKAMYGTDVFCGGDALSMFNSGTPVTFELGMNEKGQPQAMNVTGL